MIKVNDELCIFNVFILFLILILSALLVFMGFVSIDIKSLLCNALYISELLCFRREQTYCYFLAVFFNHRVLKVLYRFFSLEKVAGLGSGALGIPYSRKLTPQKINTNFTNLR